MKNSLKRSEWLLIGSFLLILGSLFLVSKVNAVWAETTLQETEIETFIEIAVDGAVSKPGKYTVPAGTPVLEAVKKARPKPFADLKNLQGPVHSAMIIRVEELKEIVVQVKGAVEQPVELVMPVKSRISDLKSKITLTPEADKAFFRRRRLLKNGEVVEVPKKTVVHKSDHQI